MNLTGLVGAVAWICLCIVGGLAVGVLALLVGFGRWLREQTRIAHGIEDLEHHANGEEKVL